MMNYPDLNTYLADGRNKDNRPIANNTRVIRINKGEIGIKLWNTTILTFYKNGKVKYDSGEWRTLTTKNRMNKYGALKIYQKDYEWYFSLGAKTCLFNDDMIFDLTNDTITGCTPISEIKKRKTITSD